MSRTTTRLNDDETVRRRSGWVIPLCVFGVTFLLSAAVLFYYLAPHGDGLFNEQTSPTSRTDIVRLRIAGVHFAVPANYLMYDSTRSGGDKNDIAIYALLPDFSGWSNWAADAFSDNAADSKVVYLTVRTDKLSRKEVDKLARVYLDYVSDRSGAPGPYGLRQYTFRPDSAYRNEDLLVGESERGPVVLRCVKLTPDVPSPNCLRETLLAPGVSLAMRFKRAHLEEWNSIVTKADRLIASLRGPAGK